VVTQFQFSSHDCNLLRTRFGYNWELADRVVKQLLSEAGVPQSFTTKVAMVPAYGIAVSQTAYVLWNTSLNHTSFNISYHTYPETFRMVERLVGGAVGDNMMPFGAAGNTLAAVINSLMNTAAVSSR
jgi:hypothetical protein